MPFAPATKQLPLQTHAGIKGSDLENPAADAINKKRKKLRINPSMAGLKAATSSKPPLSETINRQPPQGF